jgi:Putative MetA-pathway of phenol degradation
MEIQKYCAALWLRLSSEHLTMIFISLLLVVGSNSIAQDIEPRRWTPLPLGIHIVGVGYGYTQGEIFFDPLLQVEDATISINAFAAQYVRPFKLGKRLARLDVLIPYSTARWEGLLEGVPTTVKRNGFADPRIRISVNIVGPHAMGPKEMQEYLSSHPVNTTVGISFAATLPLGQYFEEKLLNLGQNRFILRPQIGIVHNWRGWSYELTGSVFLYTNNNNFSSGSSKKQDPVFAVQTHLIRRFKNKLWASLSVGYGLGGQSIVDRQPNNDDRGDVLGALSLGFPLMKKQTLKFTYVRSQTLKDIGSDTNSLVLVWSAILAD